MFDDFEFEDKYNPWDVKSLEEFFFYCCPSCPLKNANKNYFISHALAAHPESQSVIEDLEHKTIIKTEEIEHNEKEVEISRQNFVQYHDLAAFFFVRTMVLWYCCLYFFLCLARPLPLPLQPPALHTYKLKIFYFKPMD